MSDRPLLGSPSIPSNGRNEARSGHRTGEYRNDDSCGFGYAPSARANSNNVIAPTAPENSANALLLYATYPIKIVQRLMGAMLLPR